MPAPEDEPRREPGDDPYRPPRAEPEAEPEWAAAPPEPPARWPLLSAGPVDPEDGTSRRSAYIALVLIACGMAAGFWRSTLDDGPERRDAPAPSYIDQAEWEQCVADESSATDGNTVLTPQEVCSVAYPAYDGPGSVDPFSDTFGPKGDESSLP